MKKILSVLLGLMFVLALVACDNTNQTDEEPNAYRVTFNTDGGSSITAVTIEEGKLLDKPTEPEREGYLFLYWYLTDEAVEFDFNTPITSDITLNALWEKEAEPEVELSVQEKIEEDYQAVLDQLYVKDGDLSMLTRGPIHNSIITWT